MSNPVATRFSEFKYDIDQQVPFGLKIKVDEESREAEQGTICLLPKTEGAPLHLHTDQDESFTVVEGELNIQVGSEWRVLRAGESVQVPRKTPHTYANRSDDVCVFRYRLTPGGDFTRMMRVFEDLGRSGRVRKIGDPRTMIHIAAVISRFDHHVRSVRPPHFVMKAIGSLSRFLT